MILKDKTSLVTGAGNGIGRAVAVRLAKEGSTVYVNDVSLEAATSTSDLINEMGLDAVPVASDVSDSIGVKAMVDRIAAERPGLDILVHCAAIQTEAAFFDIKIEEWKKIIDVNLNGTFNICQACARVMKENEVEEGRSRGKIVTMSSIHDVIPRLNKFHYDASKGGVAIFTKELALALAPYRINVNSIAPGAIETPMNRNVLSDETVKKHVESRIPWGRMGYSEEVADLALFLVSGSAEYITGDIIRIDGGRSLFNG